jgi:hypothetical protein
MRFRAKHYWRRDVLRRRPARYAPDRCNPEGTIGQLSTRSQDPLSWFDRAIAWFTTPFKYCGISGWEETNCEAEASGRPVRDAQHSTDGFWTIDVALASFAIGMTSAPPAPPAPPKFLRLEVEPETKAHAVCAGTRVRQGMLLTFGGAVVVDTDGPFLEVHPEEDFRIGA